MKDEIQFTIHLDVKDLYHFMMSHYYSKFSGIFGIVLSLASAVFLIVKFSELEDANKVILLVMALLFTAINPFLLFTKAKAQMKVNRSLSSELTYTLDDDGISISMGEEKATVTWEQVVRVKDNKRAVIVYMTAARAYIWPKSQIASQYDDIIERLDKSVTKNK